MLHKTFFQPYVDYGYSGGGSEKKLLIFLQIISSKFMEQINLKEEVICKISTTKDPVILGDFFAKKSLVTANTLQSFHVLFLFVGELGNKKSKQS